MDEIYDQEMNYHWIGPDDVEIENFKLEFSLKSDLLCSDESHKELFSENPDKKEYEGYTGNAGPTLDYWYYRSAVVFWPTTDNLNILKNAGLSFLTSYLK